ncbi:MAG: hypothetical protein HY899_08555 [Deltaproteobacteria bacterium]|nr:hypothetical protein [Deltaproteobacteria bacterium]
MSLFVAPVDDDGIHATSSPRYDASIVHVDDSSCDVWLWVPELHAPKEVQDTTRYVWNSGLQGAEPLRFSQLDPDACYRGLVRLVVGRETLAAQRSSLSVANVRPAPWPDTGTTLKDAVDALPDKPQQGAIEILRSIVLHAASQYRQAGHASLQSWLASTALPTARGDLATPGGFAEAMRHRPSLFAELEYLLPERRMVFLVGGKQSYLPEFIDGFQDYIEARCSDHLKHVIVRFESAAFLHILDKCLTIPPPALAALDCLFASLAFVAASGLKQTTGRFLPGIFTPEMVGNPASFARSYLRDARLHQEHWDCIRDFLSFLSNAATASGITNRITVFLPFYTVEEAINGDDSPRHHLWEGLGALRQRLERQPDDCPQLGLLLAAHDLPIDRATEPLFVRHAVLRIPPLSQAELDELLRLFLGAPAAPATLALLDEYSGGDPWFLFLVLRCLKSTTEQRKGPAVYDTSEDAFAKACDLALSAVRSDGPDENRSSVPQDVRGDVDVYSKNCAEILRQYGGALGTRIVLQAWEHPVSYYARRREIGELDHAWIRTGLVYTQALGETRGDSLESLREYPVYQFCRAGKLPLKFAETALTVARGRRGQKT